MLLCVGHWPLGQRSLQLILLLWGWIRWLDDLHGTTFHNCAISDKYIAPSLVFQKNFICTFVVSPARMLLSGGPPSRHRWNYGGIWLGSCCHVLLLSLMIFGQIRLRGHRWQRHIIRSLCDHLWVLSHLNLLLWLKWLRCSQLKQFLCLLGDGVADLACRLGMAQSHIHLVDSVIYIRQILKALNFIHDFFF